MRREFSKSVRRDAAARADGKCENCGARLRFGGYHYDHVLADAMGGEPTLENCRVLCKTCHGLKTASLDVPTIAKSNRVRDIAQNAKPPKRPWHGRNNFRPHASNARQLYADRDEPNGD